MHHNCIITASQYTVRLHHIYRINTSMIRIACFVCLQERLLSVTVKSFETAMPRGAIWLRLHGTRQAAVANGLHFFATEACTVCIYIYTYVCYHVYHALHFSGLYSITPSIHRNSSFYWLKDKIWIKLSHTPPCLLVKSLFSCLEHAANMPESPSLCDLFCHIPHLRWSDTTFYRSHENIIYIYVYI